MKLNRKSISFLVLAISMALIFLLLKDKLGEIKDITNIKITDFLIISLFVFGTILTNGLKNKILIKVFNIDINFTEWFGLSAVNTLWNYLPFQGGAIAKGIYFKKKYDFQYSSYLALLTTSYGITISSLGLLGCLTLVISYFLAGYFSMFILFIFLLFFIGPLGVLFFVYYKDSHVKFSWPVLTRLIDGIKEIIKNKKIIFLLIAIDIVTAVFFALRLYCAGQALHFAIPFIFFLLVAPIIMLSIFLPLTPGGLVLREAVVGIFASWLMVNVSDSVVITVLDRGIALIWIFLLGSIFHFILSHKVISRYVK